MKSIHLLAALTAVLTLCDCRKTSRRLDEIESKAAIAGDITFARMTFESLARGDTAVVDKIDWAVFTTPDSNVGATYVALPTEVDKQKLEISFITQFAASFRESGGSLETFTNWRVTFHNSLRTEVAADAPNGVLTLTVSERDGKERVTSINLSK